MQSVIVPMCQKGGTLRQQRERRTEPDHVLYGFRRHRARDRVELGRHLTLIRLIYLLDGNRGGAIGGPLNSDRDVAGPAGGGCQTKSQSTPCGSREQYVQCSMVNSVKYQ
jgi:hypothetical protein